VSPARVTSVQAPGGRRRDDDAPQDSDLAARRVMGYPMQVHLGHILTAVALTVPRLGAWWLETACVNSRVSPFARLMADAAVP
jgi:hypothetical protein